MNVVGLTWYHHSDSYSEALIFSVTEFGHMSSKLSVKGKWDHNEIQIQYD